MSRRKTEPTLFGVMVERGGFRNAARALSYLWAWGVASRKVGHPASISEYRDEWLASEATEWRDRNALRACLPEGWDLEKMYEWTLERSGLFDLGFEMAGKKKRASSASLAAIAQLRWP